jgi:Ca-activated chloride channel family protein
MSKTALAVFLSLVTVLASVGYPQTQIRARVDLVEVPVTVRGENGKLVTGLTKDDFVVSEDGKPQTITNFDIDPQPLSAAIVVDSGMTATQLNWLYPPGAEPILLTLASSFSSDDQMIAFRYDGKVHKLSEFTNDPAVIAKSFDVLQEVAKTRPEAPRDLLGEKGPRFLRSILNALGAGKQNALKPRASGHLHDAIHEAAVALQSHPASKEDRRKVVVIISDGRVVGRNDYSIAQNTTLLLQEQIQVYGVSAEFATFGSYQMLTNYAQATGGDVYPGTSPKTLEASFGKVTEQARNQYVLGYVSSNRAGLGGVFRTITVQTKSKKQKVIHRRGYLQLPV